MREGLRTTIIGGAAASLAVLAIVVLALRGGDGPQQATPDEAIETPAASPSTPASDERPGPPRSFSRHALDELLALDAGVDAEAVARARRAHRALDGDLDTVHGLADAMLQRLEHIYPQAAPDLGRHVHVLDVNAQTIERHAALVLLAAELLTHLDAIDRRTLDAHQRADLEHMIRRCEAWLDPWDPTDPLYSLIELTLPLVYLTHFECCSPTQRAEAAATLLANIEAELDALTIEALPQRRALVELSAERLRGQAEYVLSVPDSFAALDPAERATVERAARSCAAALLDAAGRLRQEFDDEQRAGIGPEAYARKLHEMGVRETPEQILDAALADLELAVAALDELEPKPLDLELPDELLDLRSRAHVESLAAAARQAVAEPPPDPGVRFAPIPPGWQKSAAYLLPPPHHVDVPSVVFDDPEPAGADTRSRALASRYLRHTLAHESYPGHHLFAIYQGDTCRLRRSLPSPLSDEGWAMHAERLAADVGALPRDLIGEWTFAQDRAERAWWAIVDVSVHHFGLDTDAIRERWPLRYDRLSSVAGNVEFAVEMPGQLIVYFLGPRELEAIEAHAAEAGADPRLLRARFLRAGALPPWLIEDELLAGLGLDASR